MCLQYTTIFDDHRLWCFPTLRSNLFAPFDNSVKTFSHFSKHNMFIVQPRVKSCKNYCERNPTEALALKSEKTFLPCSFDCANEKLGTIGIRSSIGHRKRSRSFMLQFKVLIRELVSINWFSTCSITTCKISTLTHKVTNYSVKFAAFVPKSFFPSTQSSEVLSCFRNNIITQL